MPASPYAKITEKNLNLFHEACHWVVVGMLTLWLKTCFRMRVFGMENVPKGPHSFIAAANHSSSLDPPVLSVTLRYRPISYMAKEELFEKWYSRLFNHLMGAFSVNREKLEVATIKSAKTVLKTGRWVLGMFPEGTRKHEGKVAEMKKGVAFIAKMTEAPVLPVGIVRKGADRKDIIVRIGPMIESKDKDVETLAMEVQEALRVLSLDDGERDSSPYRESSDAVKPSGG